LADLCIELQVNYPTAITSFTSLPPQSKNIEEYGMTQYSGFTTLYSRQRYEQDVTMLTN
jgi:hypothetical protein